MEETSANREIERPSALRRRKVRKGTQSCWECKRRKIRCTFAASTESICDGCRSRQVRCISQEFQNEARVAKSKADRLSRVEALVERLANQAFTNLPGQPLDDPQNTRTKTTCRVGNEARIALSPNTSVSSPQTTPSLSNQSTDRYAETCSALLAVWPSQRELDLITSVPVGTSVLFHGTVCMPYSTFLSQDSPSQKRMLELPPPGSHPVLIARKLLLLGSFLQGIPLGSVEDLDRLGVKCREVMSHVVETASRLVTSNDDLVDSLEGIECIIIESMYQNNAGSLRRAWLINRRAMVVAQMMGLHLAKPPLSKMLDIETRERVVPEYMWSRVVISDRYLSLMLGLPQGSQESPFATPQALEGCAPMERMERILAVVGGLILQRNREDLYHFGATHKIDKQLQDAAASMPAEWWLTPDAATITGSDTNAFSETIRITLQFAHYHLLAQLHLPYMLRSSIDRKHDYSKITAVNASREILSRFVCLRGSNMITAYCRGIDFLAFIASTTLCLAHIEARRQHGIGMSNCATIFHFLAHQRLGDRGLMERTLRVMEKMVQVNDDAIACKIASILQRLLAIEAAAAKWSCFNTSVSSQSDELDFLGSDNENDSGDNLCINIPYLGTIEIEHGGVVRYVELTHKAGEENAWSNSASKASQASIGFFKSNSSTNRVGQRSDQEASPSTICLSGCQAGGQSGHTARPAVPFHLDSTGPAEESQAIASDEELFTLDDNALDPRYRLEPELPVNTDYWALQGVDMALFDSLFEGSGI